MLLEGQQIGHYRLVRKLGSGGMGKVYLAEDMFIQRYVAIKVIDTEIALHADDEVAKEVLGLFRREANAVAMLDHPFILPLFDYGEENIQGITLTYMVMPFRPEGSLADWLRQPGNPRQLSPKDTAHVVRQAASALQHAHDHQIIHRDVKPSNFLIRNRPENLDGPDVLLADFGIAKFATALSSTGAIPRGTPSYMPPEQWKGRPVPATDQYALAIMTYELLVGHPPFQGGPGQVMYQHMHVQPQPPGAFTPHIPAAIDAVILRALSKESEDRFPSMSVFAFAFQQALLYEHTIVSIPGTAFPNHSIHNEITVQKDLEDNVNGGGVIANQPQTRSSAMRKATLLIGFVLILLALGSGFIYFTRSGGGGTAVSKHELQNQTFTEKDQRTFDVSNFSLIQVNNHVGNVASDVTITVDPTANVATLTIVKNVQADNSSDANQAFLRIPLIVSPVNPTTPSLIVTICSQSNTACGTFGDRVDVTLTLPPSTTATGTYLFDIETRIGNLNVQQAQLAAGSCLSTGTGNVTFKGGFDTTHSSNLNPCGQPTSNAHPWYKIHSEVGNLDMTQLPTTRNVLLNASTTSGKIDSDGFHLNIDTSNGSDTYYGPLIPNTPQPAAELTLDVGTGDITLHRF